MQPQNYEQFAVYWTTEAGWNTELHLRNNLLDRDLVVTPSLRTADGSETALSAVTVHPADVVTIDVRAAITTSAPQLLGIFGSIVFRYQAPVPKALYAALMVMLPGTPIEFHLDAFLQPYKWVTGSREGIWWQPRDTLKDYLVLTNTGDNAVSANLVLYDSSGKAWQQNLTLGARRTTRLSVRDLLQQAGLSGSFGGITIDVAKGVGYLDSTHFVYDDSSGFLALMTMVDHHPGATLKERSLTDKQWTIRAPMLALSSPDPAMALPAEAVLQPTILLRNASANAYTAQITFNWRSDATTGKSTTAVPLQPFETRLLDVAALQKQGAIPADARWAYVSITVPVKPDELLAVAASYDSAGHYGAQTPFTDQVANYWEGGKWEVDATHNTIIAVGNAGTVPSKAQLTFYHSTGTGKYQIEKTLAPDEQIWIDMGKLIGNQVADKNGKKIPTGVAYGTYELRSLTNTPKEGLFEGKLVVDKTYGHAAHGCMECCGTPGKGFMYYDPFDLPFQSFDMQYVLGTNPCTFQDDDITSYYTSWWTGNTQVATADMNQVTAVGVGSTSNFASGTIPTGGDWESRHCPNALDNPSGRVRVLRVTITDADLENNDVDVTLSGPSDLSGTLEVVANGVSNFPQVTAFGGAALGPGTYTVPLTRPSMPADTYNSVTARWNVDAIPPTATFNLSRPWLVLGIIRHSQYNTPYESSCSGSSAQAWIFNTSCVFTQVTLKSDFISQTFLNGSGVSQNYGSIQYNNGSLCSGSYPSGANIQNSFLAVTQIKGACGTIVTGGDSIATYPTPNPVRGGYPYGCGDDLLLITPSDTNQVLKHVADFCPSCSGQFNGTNGHMDDYNSTQACSGRAVGDYGNFWTADTH